MADRVMRVKFIGDTTDLSKAADAVTTKMSGVGSKLAGIGAMFAGGILGGAVANFFGDAVKGASDLDETLNKSRVIFGQHAGAVEGWANTASTSLGLSKQKALEAASSFGNMFTQLGFSGQAAASMSQRVVQMSADLGSFNNLPTSQVTEMISAAFRGEFDSLQRLIPNISAARVQQEAMTATGKSSAAALTEQEKATAVLAIVQKDGAAAQGDFARTSDGLANQQKIAQAQFADTAATLGQHLLPVLSTVMGFISNTLVPAIASLTGFLRDNWQVIGTVAGVLIAAYLPAIVMAGTQSLIQGARIAAGWILAMGPIGWIIAAVAAVTAFIVMNWDKVKEWTEIIWSWISEKISMVWNFIWNIIKWISLPLLIISQWDTIKQWTEIIWNWISEKISFIWNFIAGVISWVWTNIIQPVWNAISAALQWLGNLFSSIGTFISLAWQALGLAIGFVYNNIIKPIFDTLGGALNTLRGWFQSAVDAIGGIWNTLKELAAAPVRFIVNTVWNDGIRKAWNFVSKLWGAQELQPVQLGFARGGAVWGAGTGTSDSVPALLSAGEHVWTAEEVRRAGGHGMVERLRRIAAYATGGPVYQQLANIAAQLVPGTRMSSGYRPGDPGYHGSGRAADLVGNLMAINRAIASRYPFSSELIYTPGTNIKDGRPYTYNAAVRRDHFDHVHWAMANAAMLFSGASGQVNATLGMHFDPLGWIKEQFANVTNFISDIVTKFGNTPFAQLLSGMARKVVEGLIGRGAELSSTATVTSAGGFGGVERWRGLVLRALGIVGQPASLVDVTLRRMNQESGGNPRAINLTDINAKRGDPSRGLMQTIGSTFRAFRLSSLSEDIFDPLANIVASMRYALSRYGSLVAAYNKRGGYLLGGLVPGTSGVGRLIEAHGGEYVLPASVVNAVKNGSGQREVHYHLQVINAANDEINLREQFKRMELMERRS